MTRSFPATGYRIRTRPLCAPGAIGMNDNLRFQSVALPLPSLGSGKREPVECGGPIHALRAPVFLLRHAGTVARRICDFCRRLKVPGNLSPFPFVHDANQSANGIFSWFVFPPILSRLPSLHAQTKAWRRQHDVQKNSASGASSYE